jgi:hypothetical protein
MIPYKLAGVGNMSRQNKTGHFVEHGFGLFVGVLLM